jgi:hypothetical protein
LFLACALIRSKSHAMHTAIRMMLMIVGNEPGPSRRSENRVYSTNYQEIAKPSKQRKHTINSEISIAKIPYFDRWIPSVAGSIW